MRNSSKPNILTRQSINIMIDPYEEKFTERPTVVLIHGWIVSGVSPGKSLEKSRIIFNLKVVGSEFHKIAETFRYAYDANVVQIIWNTGAFSTYNEAIRQVPGMALYVAEYLDKKLSNYPILWKNLTIIGHSLGAHMAGKSTFD